MDAVTERGIQAGSVQLYSEDTGVCDPLKDPRAATVMAWFVQLDAGAARSVQSVFPYSGREVVVHKLDVSVAWRYSSYLCIDCETNKYSILLAVARLAIKEDPPVCNSATCVSILSTATVVQVLELRLPLASFDWTLDALTSTTVRQVQEWEERMAEAEARALAAEACCGGLAESCITALCSGRRSALSWPKLVRGLWVCFASTLLWISLLIVVGKALGWALILWGDTNVFGLPWEISAAPLEVLAACLLLRAIYKRLFPPPKLEVDEAGGEVAAMEVVMRPERRCRLREGLRKEAPPGPPPAPPAPAPADLEAAGGGKRPGLLLGDGAAGGGGSPLGGFQGLLRRKLSGQASPRGGGGGGAGAGEKYVTCSMRDDDDQDGVVDEEDQTL